MPTQSSSTVVSRLAVAASVAALSLSARAAEITWENKTGDWTQDELWNGGVAPGPEDVVSFKSGEMTITNDVQFGDEFHIGKGGTGVLTIEATGSVTGGCYHVGRDGGNGTMIVDGGFVKATLSDWYGSFNVGWGDNSVGLVQLKSGTIEPKHVAIGRSPSATGRLEISGGEFIAGSSADFNIGHDGSNDKGVANGEVVVTGGRLLSSGGGNLSVAAGKSSIGEVAIAGGVVENSKGLRIGGASNAVGRITMTGGAWTNTENSVNIGATAYGVGYLTVNGGEFYSGKHLRVGNQGVGHLTIGGAGVVIDGTSGDEYMCFGGPDSIIRLNVGGKLYLRSILRDHSANGTVEFNGGEMIKTVEKGAYGGATGSTAIDDHHTIKILAGGMIFNSDYTSTYKGSILCPEGCGGITKRGAGELNLNTNGDRNFEFSGPIYVEGGTLRFSGNAQLPDFVDVIRVAAGATLVIPHNVTCRVLENNGTIQGGTVTVESDAATKVATKAVWTGAMDDGDVFNAKNYIVYDQNGRVMYEQTITADTPVTAPYSSGIPSFAGFTKMTWVIDDDVCSEGYSRPAVLQAAAVWYDPSDTSTLTMSDGKVTAIANKGLITADAGQQVDLDLEQRDIGKNAPALSSTGFNGRQSIFFNNASGFKSKGNFPADFTANGERTMFAVAQGDVDNMIMLTIAKGSKNTEEGKGILLAHKADSGNFGAAYKIGYKNEEDDNWKAGKASFNNVVSDTPYVFAGRTALGEGDERIVVSSALSTSGAKIGESKSFSMPAGEDETRFNVYYGSFELWLGWTLAVDTVGYQGEALIFTNALSDAEMDEVNAYLKAKWLDSNVMPDFDSLVANAQVDLGGTTRTFENLSGSGSFVDGTVVVTGDLVVTVNPDQSVVVPTFDKLVLGPSARLVVNGARNLPTRNTINIIPFASLEGEFSSVVGDKGTRVVLRYLEDHVCARRDAGFCAVLR
ncbi:MAG: hypothetical protein II840_10775 [Kiritimatiellae bacterium]|nr:hypothetical protein [Kiritimatiellia bacterium]